MFLPVTRERILLLRTTRQIRTPVQKMMTTTKMKVVKVEEATVEEVEEAEVVVEATVEVGATVEGMGKATRQSSLDVLRGISGQPV
jgi:hypothetical protein